MSTLDTDVVPFYVMEVTESKLELEKSLKLSRKLRKELNGLTEWLAATDGELTRRSAVDGMPGDLEAEVAWAQVRGAHVCVVGFGVVRYRLFICFPSTLVGKRKTPGGRIVVCRLIEMCKEEMQRSSELLPVLSSSAVRPRGD